MIDIHSEGVVNFGSILDVIGLAGRWPDAAESRVLQGRDVCSMHVLVPDSLGLDQNFQDVTIVDMGDVPESSVSLQELSLLRQQWPPEVLSHMLWLQQDLEVMRAEAKKRFRQARMSNLLRHMDKVRHVSACGKVSLGLGTVVALPSVLVHGVECTRTLYIRQLSTPDDFPSTGALRPEEVGLPGARPAPPDFIDFELEKALLQVSILPMMVTPIVDPVVESPGTPSLYPEPPLPVLLMDEQVPVLETSPCREVAGSLVLDVFPSYMASPACSVYEPVTSPISLSLREDDVSRPPSSPATMDQYLPQYCELLLGESMDLPLLAMPLTPRQIVEEMVLGSAVCAPAGEPVAAPSHSMPDLSREGPFDVHQDASESGGLSTCVGQFTRLSIPDDFL